MIPIAIPILILGESGTGKSASLRNFRPGEVALINVAGKPLPFRNSLPSLTTDSYTQIADALCRMHTPVAVIDDAQYLMANAFMRRSAEMGYQKFTDIARDYWLLVAEVIPRAVPDDRTVYILSHVETTDQGREKAKTIGRLLDDKITVEGLFSIVLKTAVKDGAFYFSTVNSGRDTVKAPMGLFSAPLIDNDLRAVDVAIREYYGLPQLEGFQPRTDTAPAPARATVKKGDTVHD